MKCYHAIKLFLFLFLVGSKTCLLAQVTTAYNNNLSDDSHQINNAYEARNWSQLAQLQKNQFFIDKNPSRLIWSARCYVWLHDTAVAFHYLDSAVKCGYTNIYILNHDTVFSSVKKTVHWRSIFDLA